MFYYSKGKLRQRYQQVVVMDDRKPVIKCLPIAEGADIENVTIFVKDGDKILICPIAKRVAPAPSTSGNKKKEYSDEKKIIINVFHKIED